MRRLWMLAVGLTLLAAGSLFAGGKAKPADEGATCGSHGTSIDFVDTPREAAAQAKKEGKLVFVLHVSGNFEAPRFT